MDLDQTKVFLLSEIKTRLHESPIIDTLFEIEPLARSLVEAEHMVFYSCDPKTHELVSKVSSFENVEIRMPIDFDSVIGGSISMQEILVISNVYDQRELKAIDPRIFFNPVWDKKFNQNTKQVLAGPLIYAEKFIVGGLIFLNCTEGKHMFDERDVYCFKSLASSLSLYVYNLVSSGKIVKNEDNIDTLSLLKHHGFDTSKGTYQAVSSLIESYLNLKSQLESIQKAIGN